MNEIKKSLKIIFILFSFSCFAIEENYKELEKIETRLKYNKEILSDLNKIEQELNFDIKKIESSLKKYKYMIKKGFYEKSKIEEIIKRDKEKIVAISEELYKLKKTQAFILEDVLLGELTNIENFIETTLKKNIYTNITIENSLKVRKVKNIQKSIEEKKTTLSKLDNSLLKIRKKVDRNSIEKERVLGETVITAIQKEENKFKQEQIKKRAEELKKLIEKLEKNRLSNRIDKSINLSEFKNMLPVGKLSIKKIKTADPETGIVLSLKNDSILKAPKEALVVYADNFKGYGNMVILDLGNSYHLIFSGLSNILCKTGDWVQKGVVLGDISSNIKNSLYMEVRFKGKPINPSKWLRS